MKKTAASLFLSLIISLPAFAGFKNAQTVNANYNPIMIYNDTNIDIAYIMLGSLGGAYYGIQRGHTDIYHSGMGDTYAQFQVGICHEISNGFINTCSSFENVNTCAPGHYNAENIKDIHVIADPASGKLSCNIACINGTSCKVN